GDAQAIAGDRRIMPQAMRQSEKASYTNPKRKRGEVATLPRQRFGLVFHRPQTDAVPQSPVPSR
ncbi:MAG TPA: hypothetical protein VGH32_07610, partial [Pirellulales bacterium]